jgi:DNA-binding CsgD family transcriptional regulator
MRNQTEDVSVFSMVYQISAPVAQKAVTLIGASTILKLFGGMGPMGISAPIPCDMVRQQEQWDHTGAESKRLRFESLSALLDLTWTVASIAKVTDSARLREVYERTAFQGHGIAQRLISEADGSESAALETKWNVVCQAVAEFETGESRVTPRHAEETAARNYVEGSSHTSVRLQRGPQIEQLTKREVEVLKWVAEGKSTKEVAGILGTSFKTAACHRYRVMDKLGIHDAVSLTRYAIRNGLIQP